jgi:hypothetical protein
MRKIETHLANGESSSLEILAIEHPHSVGGTHRYDVTGFDTSTNPSGISEAGHRCSMGRLIVLFQNGVVNTMGQNGITMEVLLAICEYRLGQFNGTPYDGAETEEALEHVSKALAALKRRTEKRIQAGTAGSYVI